ncbi:MAG TPA: hypothetical protein VM925_28900 [Labilithrix sp.]|nr:hypothetical protein [Labilithrix sp.]
MRWGLSILLPLLLASACGGDTLRLGHDNRGDDAGATLASACAAAPGEIIPNERSPRKSLDAAQALLVGRWFACSDAVPPLVPTAIESRATKRFLSWLTTTARTNVESPSLTGLSGRS